MNKKRRRLDESLSTTSTLVASGRYDPVYNYTQPSGSTVSSERNSYANGVATTANTATSSLASTRGHHVYDVTAASQKQKRNTRQQAANESKKREADITAMGLAFTHYRPPPLPPVKAPEVDVKIIHDVRPGFLDSRTCLLVKHIPSPNLLTRLVSLQQECQGRR